MFSHLKTHWHAVLLAVLVGIIIILPTLLSIGELGPGGFKGIYPLLNDDEDYYMALTRDVYDGHYNLSNPYFEEHKDGRYLFPPAPEITYSLIAKALSISVATLAIVNDFFLPMISVLLLYALFWKMTGSKKISLLLTGLFFLIFISTFGRPITPQFGFIFFLSGLNLIWHIVMNRHELRKIIMYNLSFAVCFGILVYAYPFYWMALAVVYTLWTIFIAYSDSSFRYWLKNWLAFFIPAFIFALPFALNTLALSRSSLFFETNLRMGFINTHFPGSFMNVGMMVLCIPLVYLFWKYVEDKKLAIFSLVLVLSGAILNWQNVITGKTLQFPPHFYPIGILLVFLIAALIFSEWRRAESFKYSRVFSVILLCIFLTGITYKQKGEMMYTFGNILSPRDISALQHMAEPLRWLEQNTEKDSTVYVLGDEYNLLIPVYTHNNVYFAGNAGFSLMADTELENRWAIQHFFDDITEKDIMGNREIWANKFIDTYQNKETRRKIKTLLTGEEYLQTVLMDPQFVERVLESHKKFREMGFERALKTYEADYVLVDGNVIQYVDVEKMLKQYKFLVLVAHIENVSVYKVR